MVIQTPHPLEGKIVVFTFVEQDYTGETSTFLIYRVEAGACTPIRGQLSLPPMVEDYGDEDAKSIDAIRKLGVTEVYAPLIFPGSFMGIEMGIQESVLSHINEKGELENWLEYKILEHAHRSALEACQIKVRYFDLKKGEVLPDENF